MEDGITQPTSGYFISRNGLTSASSVSTSLKALVDKEMIVFDQNKWQVYDVRLRLMFCHTKEYDYQINLLDRVKFKIFEKKQIYLRNY